MSNNKKSSDHKNTRAHKRAVKKRLNEIRRVSGHTARFTRLVYSLLQFFILVVLVYSIVQLFRTADEHGILISNIFQCTLGLITINIPSIITRRYRIYIPSIIQLVAVVFIYAHFILGEIYRVYDHSVLFDKILHTVAGLATATLGFSMVNILNRRYDEHKRLSPFFVATFSFCFSLSISYIWELFEFSMDVFFGANMQRWQDGLVGTGSGVNATGQGTGLIDTMMDMLVMGIGGLVVSIIGYISLKKQNNIMRWLMLHKITDYEKARVRAKKENNTELLSVIEEMQTEMQAREHRRKMRIETKKARKLGAKKTDIADVGNAAYDNNDSDTADEHTDKVDR